MAKPSVLDAVLEKHTPPEYVRAAGGGKLDRILANLSAVGFEEQERLIDMLLEPSNVYDNPFLLGVIADLCGEYGIGTNELTTANLSQWRNKRRRQAER